MPWFCCMAPALWQLGLMTAGIVTCMFFPMGFLRLTTALTIGTSVFFLYCSVGSMYGAYKLRQGTRIDWHALLEDLQNDDPTMIDVLHIVLLPNYMENENMLRDTLENLGRSPMARSRTRIVLAMEAREGASGREKADRLIQQTSHLFADIFATYHPQDLPGEIAGKSSNTQWAYRQAMHQYGPMLLGCDTSRVFVTVGDADTLFHPQYLSAVTYQALTMSRHERSWRIWQAPVFLMRNYHSVPCLTKATAISTIIFELSSMWQCPLPAFAFSSYTISLALASHPEVDGWDTDVIAEDHHMTCKCFFAGSWQRLHEHQHSINGNMEDAEIPAILPQMQVANVPLPSLCYLVESDGFWASIRARFQQARRHMQGIVEVGYILLQYCSLLQQAGFAALPAKTHVTTCLMLVKLVSVHSTTTVHTFCFVLGTVFRVVPMVLLWISQGAVLERLFALLQGTLLMWAGSGASVKAFVASVGNLSLGVMAYNITISVIVRDLIEGRYHEVLGQRTHDIGPVAEDDEGMPSANPTSSPTPQGAAPQNTQARQCDDGVPSIVRGPMTWLEVLKLNLHIQVINGIHGIPSMVLFGVIPSIMACTSLLRRGTDFEYIVAAKPE